MKDFQLPSIRMFATILLILMVAAVILTACAAPTLEPTAVPTIVSTKTAVPTDTPQTASTGTGLTVSPGTQFIGKEDPPDPPGYSSYAGSMLGPDQDLYAIAFLQGQEQAQQMIILERFVNHDPEGHAHFLIVDAVVIDGIPAGYTLMSGCTINEEYRDDVILLAVENPTVFGEVTAIRAWQVDRPNERLEEVDLAAIDYRCDAMGTVPTGSIVSFHAHPFWSPS